jgi:hypothetical protein
MGTVLRAAGVLSGALLCGCAQIVSFAGYAGEAVEAGPDSSADAGADASPDAGPDPRADGGEGGQPIADAGADAAAPIPITLVQQQASDFTVTMATTASATFALPNAGGNTLIVLGFWSATDSPASVTDSVGNTYASTSVAHSTQDGEVQIFYVPRAAVGANKVTIAIGGGFNAYVGLVAFEYEGLAAATLFEGSVAQAATSATSSATTPAITTLYPETLLFAGFADENGAGLIVPGSGWTSLATNSSFYMIAEAQIVSTVGAYSASATLPTTDNQWVGLLAAFAGVH